MTTYNTGNPLGSTDPRDLSDNAENFDRAVNDTSSPTWADRFGNTRTTLAGQVGYNFKGDYAAGIELVNYNDIIRYSGEFYRPSASATLPYTTTATLPDVDPNLSPVGDAVLRQDLASNATGDGSDLVAYTGTGETVTEALDRQQGEIDQRVKRATSLANLKAETPQADYQYSLDDGGRSGVFVFRSGDQSANVTADPQEGIWVAPSSAPTGASGAFSRLHFKEVSPLMFGAAGDGVTDDTTAIQSAIDLSGGLPVNLLGRDYVYSTLQVSVDTYIKNGSLSSSSSSGTVIDVAKSARLKARHVKFSASGSELVFSLGHSIISQEGTSISDRAVGIDVEFCEFSGSSYAGIYSKWSKDINVKNNEFSDIAYAGALFLSCDNGKFDDNTVLMQDAVGVSSNAYGFSLTHDTSGYNLDPSAGTSSAANPFCNNWSVARNFVVSPKIWTGIDAHGCYNSIVSENRVFGAAIGILWSKSSGDAADYAGRNNQVINNIVDAKNPNGSAVSGLTKIYGINVDGGVESPNTVLIVSGNQVIGYGSSPASTASVSIRINTYADRFVCEGNVIDDWVGYGIVLSTGSISGTINGNVFSSMSAAAASSYAIYVLAGTAVRFSIIGNSLRAGTNNPAAGLRVSSGVTGLITYFSEMRSATTEISDVPGIVRTSIP